VKAVLEDESLPIDREKVTIGGSSAGANLSLACSQDPSLQGKIGGLVAYYPPSDISTPVKVSMASRPVHAGKDSLETAADMFNWAYCTVDVNLRDPQLSPTYAERAKLPPKLYIVGCEFDMLCRDSEIMAEKFASVGNGKRTGTDDNWERNGVKWEKVLGEDHGMPPDVLITVFATDFSCQHSTLSLVPAKPNPGGLKDGRKCTRTSLSFCFGRCMSSGVDSYFGSVVDMVNSPPRRHAP
jgi:alpha/beta hydrolase fold